MIIKIDKKLTDLKIGLLGFRAPILVPALIQYKCNPEMLKSPDEIDESYDLVIETGVYYKIPEKYLAMPKYGIIGFHETPMPEGRGSAPLQWTIINKRNNLVVTLYKLDKDLYTGDIIYQVNVPVEKLDTYDDMEKHRAYGISLCLSSFLGELEQGIMVNRPQTGKVTIHKMRTPKDSILNPLKTLEELWDDIRMCDNENYPAYFNVDGKKVILRYEVTNENI